MKLRLLTRAALAAALIALSGLAYAAQTSIGQPDDSLGQRPIPPTYDPTPQNPETWASFIRKAIANFTDLYSVAAVTKSYQTATNTTGFTATTTQLGVNSQEAFLALTGTLGAGAAITMPTCASLVAASNLPVLNRSWRLRVINASSANFAWTVTGVSDVTVTGTATVAQNTWREFIVTFTAIATPACTMQSVGTGTFS